MQQLKLIVQILPVLIDLIRSIESALPEGGLGKQKLQFVRELIQNIAPELLDNWPMIEKVVSAVVGLFNQIGIFKKG